MLRGPRVPCWHGEGEAHLVSTVDPSTNHDKLSDPLNVGSGENHSAISVKCEVIIQKVRRGKTGAPTHSSNWWACLSLNTLGEMIEELGDKTTVVLTSHGSI